MSQFTLPIGAQGAIVSVVVTPSGGELWALDLDRNAPPRAQAVRALADTGANRTCLDPSVLQALDLEASGNVQVSTPLLEAGTMSRYRVGLVIPARIPGEQDLIFDTLEVVSTELQRRFGVQALLGRDVLDRCLLFYNGPEEQFTLAY